MEADHVAIEKMIDRLYKENADHQAILEKINLRLIRHFDWEEKVLFPEFENKAGAYGEGIVFILKSEHRHIKEVFLKNLIKLYKVGGFPEIKNSLFGMIETLKMHKDMEHDIFYPWFQHHLEQNEINSLIERMKS
jgi:iron-sulfur cluster repair protein YtfE (RIC family)